LQHFVNIWALSSVSRFNDRDKYVLPAARVAATFLMQTFTSGYRKIYCRNSCYKLSLVFLQLDRNAKKMVSINFRKHWRKKKKNPLIYLGDKYLNSFCSLHHNVNSMSSSVFLSSCRGTAFSDCVRKGCFLILTCYIIIICLKIIIEVLFWQFFYLIVFTSLKKEKWLNTICR